MSYCIAVCLQVGKMAVRFHASFFRAGKSTPSSLSVKLPPGRDSVEECREAFLKCLCLTALKVCALFIRWNGGTRTSTGNCIAPSKLAHGIRLSDPNAHYRASTFVLSQQGTPVLKRRLSNRSPTCGQTSVWCSLAPRLEVGLTTILLILLNDTL